MPFTNEDLEAYLRHVSLSEGAKQYLIEASTGPSRTVGRSSYRTVSGEFQSSKMGTSVLFESRSGELAYAIHLEYNKSVIAYYDQPPAIDCRRRDRNGRSCTRQYHPDFLVLYPSEIEVVQVKPPERLDALRRSNSADWHELEGVIIDEPASRAFGALGIEHRVVSTATLSRVLTANLSLLLQSRESETECSEKVRASVMRCLEQHAAMPISAVAAELGVRDLTPILKLIDDGSVFVDLDRSLLANPDSCWISRHASLLGDGSFGEGSLVRNLAGRDSATLEHVPKLIQAERALEILEKLKCAKGGRSARRWNKQIQMGRAHGRSDFLAVVPKFHHCGNRGSKRPVQVLALAEDVIRENWAHSQKPSVHSVYRQYRVRAEEWHPALAPVTRPTFYKIVDSLRQGSAIRRGGTRAKNAEESPSNVEERVIKPLRPFELATCDHYLCDVSCVVLRSKGRKYTRRPWLTVLRDCGTNYVLAYWIWFRQPSRLACAMVLRSCLRRHGRLPEGIIVDRGAEFQSTFFSALLAHVGTHVIDRPTSHPRYGSEAERYFGEFKSLWLDLRPGNWTSNVKLRSVSGTHAPQVLSELTLPNLLAELQQFNDWLNRRIPNSKSVSPELALSEGLERFPFSGKKIAYDEKFEIASAVDVRSFKLDASRGLKVGPTWYWGPQLSQPNLRACQIEVRLEPEDTSVIYALVSDVWIRCYSSAAPVMATQDFLHRLAQSISTYCSEAVYAKAREDADRDLVHQQRLADQRLRSANAPDAIPKPIEADAKPKKSLFDEFRSAQVSATPVSNWRSK